MSGVKPRRKGDRLERAIVNLFKAHGIEAHRVPLSGSVEGYPGDVVANLPPLGKVTLECKSRKEFKTIYSWLEEKHGLILRGDRRPALVVLPLEDLLRLLGSGPKMRPKR
jgi:hypothetical protein